MSPKFLTTSEWIEQASQHVISEIINDIKRLTFDPVRYPDEVTAIFMAWAPGSGKTEFILSVLSYFDFFFIDIDNYRSLFEWYCGENAREYQQAMSKVVDRVLRYCLDNNIRFILDGTFKSGRHSLKNIEACKKQNRKVDIYFIFQNPYISHYYTFLREIQHTRKIEVEGFIECFYKSIKNVYIAYTSYRNTVNLYICEKAIWMPLTKKKYVIHSASELGTIEKFCIKFNIEYTSSTKKFNNLESLKKELENDRRLFKVISPALKFYFFIKKKLWQRKQETSSNDE